MFYAHQKMVYPQVRKCIGHMDYLLNEFDNDSCIISILKSLDKGKCGVSIATCHNLSIDICHSIVPRALEFSMAQNGKHLIVRLLNLMSVYPLNSSGKFSDASGSGYTRNPPPKSSRLLMDTLLPKFVELSCDWHGNHVVQALIDNVRNTNDEAMWKELSEVVDANRFLLTGDQYGKHVVKVFELTTLGWQGERV